MFTHYINIYGNIDEKINEEHEIIHIATTFSNDMELIKYLFKYYKENENLDINVINCKNETAFDLLCQRIYIEGEISSDEENISSLSKTIEQLIDENIIDDISLNKLDNKNCKTIHYVAGHGTDELLIKVIEKTNFSNITSNANIDLMRAISMRSTPLILEYILTENIDINIFGNNDCIDKLIYNFHGNEMYKLYITKVIEKINEKIKNCGIEINEIKILENISKNYRFLIN